MLKRYVDSYGDVLQSLYPLQPNFFPDDAPWLDRPPPTTIDSHGAPTT